MKSIRCKPRYELAEPALWLAGFALLFLYVGASNSSLASLHLTVGLICLLLAAGVWQELRAAVVTAAVLCAFAAINFSVRTVLDYSWMRMISAGMSAWLAYRFMFSLRRWNEDRGGQESPNAEADKPMISIVLLLSRPKALDATILSHIVQAAWGGDYTSGDEQKQDGFVVGDAPVFILKSKPGLFLVHNHPSPYWEDVTEAVAQLAELRLRKALLDHAAWLSVDLLSPEDPTHPPETYYPAIIRLIYELADDTVVAVLRPETGQVNLWTDDVLEALLMPSGENRFSGVQSEIPVIPVEDDDEAMNAAIETARGRWDEFVQAFRARGEHDMFSIKAPVTAGGNTEHIWVEVKGISSGVVFGNLGNEPVALQGLALGSPVEIPEAEISDWCYVRKDSEPVGLFSLPVLQAAQQRRSRP